MQLSARSDGEKVVVFDNAGSEIPYRIPALAQTPEGDIIALCDYRYSKADIGMVKNGKVDIIYRLKDRQTGEWGPVETLAAAFGEGDDNIAFGDPCVVADKDSEKLLVLGCVGNVSFPKGTHDNHQGVARFYSEDGGKKWSSYEDIGDQFLTRLDQRENGPVRSFFVASGKIEQSDKIKTGDYKRIYAALLVKDNEGKNVNYVFFSDDLGGEWKLLGDINDCPVPEGGDEAKVVELPDGNVMISSRIKGGRAINLFRYTDINDGTGQWDKTAVSDSSVNGIVASTNACNGEILCIPVVNNENSAESWLLLQSVPLDAEGKRAEVGINFKELNNPSGYSSESLAKDWDGYYTVTPSSSAYSTMLLNQDSTISFFYEENVKDGGYDLIYCELPVEEITAGKFSPRKI